jgi:hypothetical protein
MLGRIGKNAHYYIQRFLHPMTFATLAGRWDRMMSVVRAPQHMPLLVWRYLLWRCPGGAR